jgi:DNA-binding CsgD family transcriptional regulator
MYVIADPLEVVTPRQLELLALYASGQDIAAIGEIKHLSPFTVRNIMANARERVGARNLTHLCVILLDSGLLVKNGTGYMPVQDERLIG